MRGRAKEQTEGLWKRSYVQRSGNRKKARVDDKENQRRKCFKGPATSNTLNSGIAFDRSQDFIAIELDAYT
jgi:hypothetical protein